MLLTETGPVDAGHRLSRTADRSGARTWLANAAAIKDGAIRRGVDRWGIRFGPDSGSRAGD
jgi:hypothetical protein